MKPTGLLKKIVPKSMKTKLKKEFGGSADYRVFTSEKDKLHDKFAVVTGGSGAIGSAICFKLAMQGATVAVCGRSIEKTDLVVHNITKNNGKAFPVILDVTDEKIVSEKMKYLYERNGSIDILVNNAGGSAREDSKLFAEQEYNVIKDVVEINLQGTMMCTNYALKYMKTSGARIINMSSVVGMQGKDGMTDYAASKAGIVGFTKSLAIELGKYDTTVNCVSPGWVNRKVFDLESDVGKGNVNCMGHSGKTDDVSALVAFLASDDAGYITGQNIIVDGGRSLGLWGDH